MINKLFKEIEAGSNPERAEKSISYMKVYKGGYGEGDLFLGASVPLIRNIAKKYHHQLNLVSTEELIQHAYHEMRLLGLIILTLKFEKAFSEEKRKEIVDLYLKNTRFINNWDLVDTSAYKILGTFLLNKKDRSILYNLAGSSLLWDQRIAVVSTFAFIRNNEFSDLLQLAEKLIHHPHDLMHKAIGWMLRELGKRSQETEKEFLKLHYHTMPRTMLRYAIEKFTQEERKRYLKGEI